MFVLQSGQSRHNIRRKRAVQENVRSSTTQLHQIEAARCVLEGRERQRIQVFEFGNMSSEVTLFRLRLGWR